MISKSIDILNLLLGKKTKKRLEETLIDPIHKKECGWFVFVPTSFNECLDIQKNNVVDKKEKKQNGIKRNKIKIWTQGDNFSFQTGNVGPGETATNDFIKTVWFEVINNWKVMNFCLNELEHRDIADLYKNVYDGIPKALKEKDIP